MSGVHEFAVKSTGNNISKSNGRSTRRIIKRISASNCEDTFKSAAALP